MVATRGKESTNSLIYLIASGDPPRDDQTVRMGAAMRRDELMKPDAFSELVLTVVGLAIFLFLASTAWMAVLNH